MRFLYFVNIESFIVGEPFLVASCFHLLSLNYLMHVFSIMHMCTEYQYISPWHFGVFMMHSMSICEVFAYKQPILDIMCVQDLNVAVADCFNRDSTELQSLILLCILTACVSMCMFVWFPFSSVSLSTVTFCEWQWTVQYSGMVKNILQWTREDRPSVVLPLFLWGCRGLVLI